MNKFSRFKKYFVHSVLTKEQHKRILEKRHKIKNDSYKQVRKLRFLIQTGKEWIIYQLFLKRVNVWYTYEKSPGFFTKVGVYNYLGNDYYILYTNSSIHHHYFGLMPDTNSLNKSNAKAINECISLGSRI